MAAFCTFVDSIIVPSPKSAKLFIHGDTLYQLFVTKVDQEDVIKISPLFKIPKCAEPASIKPVKEHQNENIDEESQSSGNINRKWKPLIKPPDLITQIRLSRYGKYLGYPRFYGLSGAYGFYHYNAGNDVNNNLPRGGYKFEADIDSK